MAAAKKKAAAKKPAKKKAAAKKRGRPPGSRSKPFKEEYVNLAFRYSLLGLIDEEMASLFNVGIKLFNQWKKEHPEFKEALKKGKDDADSLVAQSLFKKAIGFIGQDGKFYPPETVAQIFWLKNRQPGKWRDKPDPAGRGGKGSPSQPFTFNVSEPSNPDLAKDPEELGEGYKGGRVDTDYSDGGNGK